MLSTFFLFLFALTTGVGSNSGLCKQFLEFLVIGSEFETLFISRKCLVVFLHSEVAVTLLGVGLNVCGIECNSLFEILKSTREFHKLDVADTSVSVVLGILGASANGFRVFLQCKRELSFSEEDLGLFIVLFSNSRVDVCEFILIFLEFLNALKFKLDLSVVIFQERFLIPLDRSSVISLLLKNRCLSSINLSNLNEIFD